MLLIIELLILLKFVVNVLPFAFVALVRSFIFPFLLRGNKTTPVSLCFLAAMFCLCNGFMQGARLIYGTQHSADWLRDPRFIIGKY